MNNMTGTPPSAPTRAQTSSTRWKDRNTSDAITLYRKAILLWQKVGSPLNVAIVRLLLAQALVKQSNFHNAELELLSAENCFQNAGATVLLENYLELKQQLLGGRHQ
jgi:hypothetical protein